MRILEFAQSGDRSLKNVASYLSQKFGGMDRVGGKTRVFQIEDSNRPMALFVTRDGKYGFGLAWESGQHDTLGITTVYVWYNFDMLAPADLAIDIPMEFSFEESKELLVQTIKNPVEGMITEGQEQITEMARRSNEVEFTQMAQAKYGENAAKLTWPEIVALAAENDVQVPGSIRMNRDLKVDAHHWNLSGSPAQPERSFDQDFEAQTGQKIDPEPEDSEELRVLKGLQAVNSMAAKGKKLYLMSHKPNGAFYKIPGVEVMLSALQRSYENAMRDSEAEGEPSMEEQYENLQDRVKLVASGESNFIKSLLIMGAPSSGKALALDTPIPTPTGWTTMGDIKEGDLVYDENGQPCRVTLATDVQYDRECYEVEFDDGTKIVADADHRWLTSTVSSRQSEARAQKILEHGRTTPYRNQEHKRTFPSVVNTKQIANSLWAGGKYNHQIINTATIAGEDKDLLIPPYVLGAWLGDGCASNATMTCSKDDIRGLEKSLAEANQPFKSKLNGQGSYTVQLSDGAGGKYETKLPHKLRLYNLIKNKHIPIDYLRASEQSRLELLRGLMDTDGYVSNNGHCEFCTVSQQLANDVHELISGLGMTVRITESKVKYRDGYNVRYRLHFTPRVSVFNLERKSLRQKPVEKMRKKSASRTIIACRPVPSVPVKCISVDSPNHLFLCSKSFIPTHNTFSVMQAIKSVGLEEGVDYVVKKGRISVPNVYRTLIEQVNGMVIFDDCDSVVEDKDGVNMLKGALDTDPVREISYDVGRKVNTAVMTAAERDDYVEMCSRILRGKATDDDLRFYLPRVRKPIKIDGEMVDPTFETEERDVLDYDVQQHVMNNLPNKIDFKGRIIFISNMSEDEWDSAILTRAFTINMNFSSGEMLDYIDKIKKHIRTPSLTEEQKQEVVDYLRELYTTGRLSRDVNFRLMMQCFDIRLLQNWKKQIADSYGNRRGK